MYCNECPKEHACPPEVECPYHPDPRNLPFAEAPQEPDEDTAMQYTPGPWITTEHHGSPAVSLADFPQIICTCGRQANGGKANADFIARACNAHNNLLAACQVGLQALYSFPEVGKVFDQQHRNTQLASALVIHDAIAKAKKGT